MYLADSPVVFLHGLFGRRAIRHALRRRLAGRGSESIALPLPGYRRATPDYRETCEIRRSADLTAHLAAHIVAGFGGRPGQLFGHSLKADA